MAQRGPKTKIDWESVKASYLASNHSTREIAELFGLNPGTVAQKAKDDGWIPQRKRLLAPLTQRIDAQIGQIASQNVLNLQENGSKEQKLATQNAEPIPAEERIKAIRPKKDLFRERVAAQTDRLLDHLEGQDILNNMQADAFVTILEKTEKVGSRARGLDREDEKSRNVLINLSVLNGATETATARVIASEPSNAPALES